MVGKGSSLTDPPPPSGESGGVNKQLSKGRRCRARRAKGLLSVWCTGKHRGIVSQHKAVRDASSADIRGEISTYKDLKREGPW